MISTCFVNTRVFIKDLLELYRLARDGEAVNDIVQYLRLVNIEI